MKIIKRNGSEVAFDITKIIVAITKANEDVDEADRMTPVQIRRIAESVELQCQKMNRAATVEEIQDMVEHHIMAHGAFEVAKHYITYRYTRSLVRRSNTTDDKILSLIECNNEEAKQENSNKNPVVNSTQRDYMAGEVSRDITNRLLLPREIVEAHEEGIIHFHDTDYYAQHMHNCDLVNLEDMLQNGTVITGTLIERPHSFATACNIANAGNYEPGKHKYYGRFNQGVVTINLPDVALSSGGNIEKFWKIFDERLELCHRALRCRHERLKGTTSDAAPILWQYGALARLKKGEVIDKLLYGGYSTISLGYAGLYECVKFMTGKSHTDPSATPFALSIMQKMNDKCKEWKNAEDIDYSLYGTPLESTTYKFAKCLQKRFGVIEGITDKGYITNSYHVHVTEPIDAFTKLEFEAQFQHLSPGGAISYVEVPDMQNNIPAVLEVMKFIYDHIIYAELNTKSDYCQVCGWDGEISVVEEDGKLIWKCPQCGNTDQDKMNVARRTCGYIGTQFWNQGRTQEIKDRVLHL